MKPTAVRPREIRRQEEKTKKKHENTRARRLERPRGGRGRAPQGTRDDRGSASPGAPHLELYQREDDPKSHAVRTRMTALGLDFVAHAISPTNGQKKREQLIRAGGKDQIPFLHDRTSGVKIYDSQDIIDYLDNEYGHASRNALVRWAQKLQRRAEFRVRQLNWAMKKPVSRSRGWFRQLGKTWLVLHQSYREVRRAVGTRTRQRKRA